ncbi:hypothetical protein [Pedobacter cryoconitis]|uniref:Lipoprotein n=1 Tax=Pedobacter cryoconitis TaxID=188932 RepID=A0A7X0J1L5_9SPHI|nr:hypothetical protein [Pedobacter cryoconitis]MBB6499363.1 hypothetical protein [Pedobacter cryoconitis]
MRNLSLLFALFSLITACTNQAANSFVNYQDTVSILNCVFNDPGFQTIVTPQTQTLMMVKNKYTHDNWPERIGHFNIVYNQQPDVLISKNHFLYSIENFEVNKQEATLSILCLNKKMLLTYSVIKKDKSWEVKTFKYK